jgi:hypothetical protein
MSPCSGCGATCAGVKTTVIPGAGGGTGAVSSVNGDTGAVVLDAADVGAAPTTRSLAAGAGLTGGGDLSADRSFAVGQNADNSIVVNADDIQVNAALQAAAALGATAVQPARTLTAGAGLTGGGSLASDRTFTVGQNADASVVVNADDVQVAAAIQSGAALGATAVQPARTISTTAPLAGGGDLSANRTFTVGDSAATTKGVVTLNQVGCQYFWGHSTANNSTSPRYANIGFCTSAVAITESIGQLLMLRAGLVTQLQVRMSAATVTANMTWTLRKNGVDTAATVTVNQGATSGSITGQAISVAVGDLLGITSTASAAETTVISARLMIDYNPV